MKLASGVFVYMQTFESRRSPFASGIRRRSHARTRSSSCPDEERVRAWLRRRMPLANGERRDSKVCMYTNTPDANFIVDRLADHPNVVVASACSGHGFKFSSVIGEILADLVLDGETRHPIGFLSADRLVRR